MIWSKIITESIVPTPRWGSTFSRIKQKLYLIGGSYNKSTKDTSQINSYNILTNIWEEENYSIKRTHHIAIPLFDRFILVHGGHIFKNKQIKQCDQFTVYDTQANLESKPILTTDISIPSLMYHSWCFTNEEHTQILVYGGCTVESKELNKSSYLVDINQDKHDNSIITLGIYKLETPTSPDPYIFSTLTYYPDYNCSVLIGGCSLDYRKYNEDIWIFTYDFDNKCYKWNKIGIEENCCYTPKWGHIAEYMNGKIYIFGGMTSISTTYVDTNDIIEITINNNNNNNNIDYNSFKYDCSVSIVGSLNPDVRRGHCSLTYNNSLYILGGFNNNGFYNDMWFYSNKKKIIKGHELKTLIESERKNQLSKSEYAIEDSNIIDILQKENIRYDMIASLTSDDLVMLANKYDIELKDFKYGLNMEGNTTLYKYDLLFENEEIYNYVKENEFSIERAQDILKNMKILGLTISLDLFKEYFVDKGKLKKVERSEKELVSLNKRLEKMKKVRCKKCEKNIISYCAVPCGCYYYCEECANDLKGKQCIVCNKDVERVLKIYFSEVD